VAGAASMAKANGLQGRYKMPLLLLGIVILIMVVVLVLAAAALMCLFFYTLGSIDDPFRPHAPDYHYTTDVTGLDGFTTANGSAVILLPLPVVNGTPVLPAGWWVNYPPDPREQYHGMQSLAPLNTSEGPMLEARINMTDYYISYARVTPIAVSPGQDDSTLPAVVPDVINKSWSFDDVAVIASGGIQALDYPTSAQGRTMVKQFLEAPLLPAENVKGLNNFTTYVYIDPALRPLHNDSIIRVSGTLAITLNHNKVNASEEGVRRFEYHKYIFNEEIPGGVTGYVPVSVNYSSFTGLYLPM
jgi:hypothetical protein